MKATITLFLLCLFLQTNAQDSRVYIEAGTSFFLQVGPTDNLYSKLVSIGTSFSPFIDDSKFSRIDRSISTGIALELVRSNVGFRLQTNRIKIDETFEISSTINDSSFGQFTSENTSVTRGNQINYEVVPGVHRYFQINKWLFSAGIEAPFTVYDIYQLTTMTNNKVTSISGDFSFKQTLSDEQMSEIPGGYDVGLGSNFGLQYAFNNNLKVAIQYAPSIRHYKIGGETASVRRFENVFVEEFDNQGPITTSNSSIMNTTSTSTLSKTAEFRQRMNFALIFSF